MIENEIVVSGGEEGRLTAYFDANFNLQIFAGGTLWSGYNTDGEP